MALSSKDTRILEGTFTHFTPRHIHTIYQAILMLKVWNVVVLNMLGDCSECPKFIT